MIDAGPDMHRGAEIPARRMHAAHDCEDAVFAIFSRMQADFLNAYAKMHTQR